MRRHPAFLVHLTVCLLLLLALPPLAARAESTAASSASDQTETAAAISDLQRRIDQLDPEDTAPQTRSLRDIYQQTLNTLNSRESFRTQAEQLNQQIESQPNRLAELRRQVDSPLQEALLARGANPTPDALDQRLTVRGAELIKLEQQRDQLSLNVSNMDERLISLRDKLSDLKKPSAPTAAPSTAIPPELADATTQLQNAKAQERTAQIQALELELLALPGERELMQLQISNLKRQIANLNSLITELQDKLQNLRRQEAEASLSELQSLPDGSPLPAPLAAINNENQSYSDSLRDVLQRIDDVTEQQRIHNDQLDQITQNYSLIQQQLELAESPLSGQLRSFTRQLTRPVNASATRAEINTQRLQNLVLSRDQISVEQLQANPPPEIVALPAAQRLQYKALLNNRLELFQRLQQSRQRLINQLSQLLSLQEQVNKQLTLARDLIDRHLLWQPTVTPLSLGWFGDLSHALQQLPQQWQTLSTAGPLFYSNTRLTLVIGVPLVLLMMALLSNRYLRNHRERWAKQIGNVTQDRFGRTLRVLLAAPLAALPLPVFFLLLAKYGLEPSNSLYDSLTSLLWMAAGTTFAYRVLRHWLATPGGLLSAHLGVSERLCALLSRECRVLYWIAVPLLAALLLSDALDDPLLLATGGRILLILLILTLLRFWWVLERDAKEINLMALEPHWWRDARLWIGALLAFNLLMLLLVLAGYLVSALFLILIVTAIILLLVMTFVLYRLGIRWLLIEERHLAFEQARQRRAERLAAREHPEEEQPLKEDYLDLQTTSEQTQTLMAIAAITTFALVLWLTLGDLLPSLNILDGIELWSSYQDTADGSVLRATTLGNVLTGVLILGFSIVAAYNLPGLLELLVLRHVKLTPGSNYAITTLLKYMLIMIGALAGFSQFGLQWSKLQWLVAALGVGLGFGLQEIVANFVSGLILLFERPIRIGDTITIGDVTGNVSSIRIRATTITDWDRKEVVIPNKTFITEQLLNWTLSDSVTRVVIRVGVAYGSDVDLAQQLLLRAAEGNELVLKDPAPVTAFTEFADSTLNLELRVYVNALSDRVPVTTQLNHTIDRLYREHAIEIAFPQLDVHLHRVSSKKS